MERWSGKVAVVTGSSSGIGAQIAIDLANAGVQVVGLARRVDRVEELRSRVKQEFRKNLHAHQCDVGNEDSVKSAFAWIEKNFEGIHILIHIHTQLLKDVIDTNVWGVIYGLWNTQGIPIDETTQYRRQTHRSNQ